MFLVFKSLLRRVALASGLLVLATNASIAQGTGAGEYGEGSVFDWNVFEVNDPATAVNNLHSTGDCAQGFPIRMLNSVRQIQVVTRFRRTSLKPASQLGLMSFPPI